MSWLVALLIAAAPDAGIAAPPAPQARAAPAVQAPLVAPAPAPVPPAPGAAPPREPAGTTRAALCAEQPVGHTSCVADELQRCGADRVNLEHAPCCGTCVNGSCQAARCGDGKVDGLWGEECDDGNTTSGDGCTATCKVEIQ